MDSQNNSSATIGRTFSDIPEKTAEGSERAWLYKPPGFGWDELLKSPRVLIVSEAGAGKTFECRQQQKTLWAADEAAFYVELSALASTNLPDLLIGEENSLFRRWLGSQTEIATFFLDSIDELKLTRGSFETALKRLNNAVARNMDRVRVVITTRPTPFDRHLIQQYLPAPQKPAATPSVEDFADEVMHRKKAVRQWVLPPDWRYVSLEPLSKHQIQAIASENRVTDTDKLLDHIYRNHLDEFVQRPQDLIELCVDWQPSGLMRDHRAQIENNIHIKLKSRTDRNEAAQLPDAKALEGASRLALAALLTRKLTIRHSAEADKEGEAGTALSPETILSDWTPDERKTLLERALFDFATYGRVRFHHRSVIEYLATRQLEKMLEQGTSIKAVKRLLFAETPYGIKIVKPTMQPVAAWLAAGNTSLFDEVLSREPDVLLNFGGPQSLSLEQRQRALREYVARFGEGARRDLHVPRVQVRRFASPELVPEALRLLNAQIQNPEVRELLMELIANAPTKDAAEFAYALVMRGDASLGERLYALDVLIALNNLRLNAVRKAMLDDVAAWTNDITGRAILRLFPTHAPIDWLRSILPRTTEEPRSVGILNWYWPQAIADAQLGSADLDVLREVLTDIVRKDIAHHKESDKIFTPMQHLVSPLAATCACLLQGRGVASEKVIESSVTALRVAMDNHVPDEHVSGLNRLLAKGDASIRERTFWALDELNQRYSNVSDPWSRLHKVLDQDVVNLNPGDDEAWILNNILDRDRNTEERKLMIATAIHLQRQQSTVQHEYVTALKKHVADSLDLIAFIDHFLKPPPPNLEHERIQAEQQQRKREKQKEDDDARASWNEFRDEVKNNPAETFRPDKVENTISNLWQAMRNAGAGNRSYGWSRQFIEQYFDKDIADKLRSALMQFWRSNSPKLRSERNDDKKSDIYHDDQLGLAAIEAESEDTAWSSKLSPDEAKLAARYVPNVLNGFPVWIGNLIATHPLDVESILGSELIAELNEQSATSSFSMLLQNVHYANKEVAAIFIPRLVAWLTENASRMRNGEEISATVDRLQKVGDVLSRHGDAKVHEQLKVIALQQLEPRFPISPNTKRS